MDPFYRIFVNEEKKRLQQRVQELEAENEHLKNRNEMVKELMSYLIGATRIQADQAKEDGSQIIEKVVALTKELSEDLKNLFRKIT